MSSSYMKEFLFAGEQAGTPASASLSGGERGPTYVGGRPLAKAVKIFWSSMSQPTISIWKTLGTCSRTCWPNIPETVLLISHDRDFSRPSRERA